MKNALERVVAGRPGDDPAVAEEAGRLLLEVIRLEGRADRLLSRADRDPVKPESFHGMPLQEAAYQVLLVVNEPLHVRELAARIKAGGWRHPRSEGRPEQLAQQLAARLPRYPEFKRVRPNTFGLAQWAEPSPAASRGPRALFGGTNENLGSWIGEHPEAPFEKTWPSS